MWSMNEKFQISNSEVTTGTSYYGYENKDDNSHYIMKAVKAGDITTYSFACGKLTSDYATNWAARAGLTYYSIKECWKSENLI